MLQDLQRKTLCERRAHNKVIMLYRIVHGLVAITSGPPFFYPSPGLTRGHSMQFRQHCRIIAYQQSFFPSVVSLWNQLPATVVSRIPGPVSKQAASTDTTLLALLRILFTRTFCTCTYLHRALQSCVNARHFCTARTTTILNMRHVLIGRRRRSVWCVKKGTSGLEQSQLS